MVIEEVDEVFCHKDIAGQSENTEQTLGHSDEESDLDKALKDSVYCRMFKVQDMAVVRTNYCVFYN